MARILIVEDDSEIRTIEKDYLQSEGFKTIEAENGIDALKKFFNTKSDLVLLDLNLPGKDGIQVCKEIRKHSGVPIIMVTARTKEMDELLGLEIGADDYLKKPFSPKILVARVKSLLKRPKYNPRESVINRNELELDLEKIELKKNGNPLKLTTVQFNILSLMMLSPGKVFSRNELMDSAYDTYDMPDIFDRTIDSHIKNIRKAIEKNSRKPEYIITVRGKGYKFNNSLE